LVSSVSVVGLSEHGSVQFVSEMVSAVGPSAEDLCAGLLEQTFAKSQSINKLRGCNSLMEPTVAVMKLPEHGGLELVQQAEPSTGASLPVLLDRLLATN
jgi:hypothetical protein